MRIRFLGISLLALGTTLAAFACAGRPANAKREPASPDALAQGRVEPPDFPAGLQWLNTDKPVSLKDLRGKVVLIDFWTYCCINCIHTIPTLQKLEAKFPNELVVIGVHSGKFDAEKDADNIREAILRYEIEHPVVNDKDYVVWRAYGAQAWPTLVLIDPEGKAFWAGSGEPDAATLERMITNTVAEFERSGKLNRKPIKFALEKDKRLKPTLAFPGKLAADEKTGRLFIADSNNNRIVVTTLQGEVKEVIGDGGIGLKDGSFEKAQFYRPQGMAFDAATETLYVADTNNHAIRKVALKSRSVTTLAGTGKQMRYPPRGGVGRNVSLGSPWDVLKRGEKLFIAMAGSHQIWTLDLASNEARPYAGTGGEDIVDGPRSTSLLAQPSGMTTDGKNLYFADSEVSAVRAIDLQRGEVTTLIGKGLFEFGDIDGPYPGARLQHPLGVAYRDGYVYVADAYNHKIKRVNVKTRTLETFIGTGKRGAQDGEARQASLNEPNGLIFVGHNLYIADTNNSLIRVFDMDTKRLSTLKFTGIEKLAPKKTALK